MLSRKHVRTNVVQLWLLSQIFLLRGESKEASWSKQKNKGERLKQTWVLLSWKAFGFLTVQILKLLHTWQRLNSSSLYWIRWSDICLLCLVCSVSPWGKLVVHSSILIWQTLSNTNPVGISEDKLKCALALEQMEDAGCDNQFLWKLAEQSAMDLQKILHRWVLSCW